MRGFKEIAQKFSREVGEDGYEDAKAQAKEIIDDSEGFILVAKGETEREGTTEATPMSNMMAGNWTSRELVSVIEKLQMDAITVMEELDQ